ncbi:MAG: Re/Si-specific NAD(P)(+) transhydrogenase subunit alpha [Candidatus Omnitrophota bacterium]|jgi:NAD(P) transhydrogenase subunit alpha|nr:MAG: Re/Si-specific NAD(P)(+) transhydrogenase subunit alpha [Candidatus Omnitrophota bacterium]
MTNEGNSLRIGVPRETFSGERRASLIPGAISSLRKAGMETLIEAGAGMAAGFADHEYEEKGARIITDRDELFSACDVILQVRGFGTNQEAGKADLARMKPDQVVIGCLDPLSAPAAAKELAQTGATAFSMELMPRITRAQSMDVLSSMATIAGYKAVLMAADTLPKMFPMMMTAAGTLAPARVFVVGAGVAGLQAIASSKRLGAVVHAYDVRPAVKDQVLSLGGKFVELELETADAEDTGGYAKAQDETFYKKQRAMMKQVVAESDVVITTAAIPGKKSPILVTAEMVQGMKPGSVIVDLAAERGGNCALTKAGETVVEHGVTILGPLNLPATVPYHASQMYSKNISTFLLHLVKEGNVKIDREDEITRETLVAKGGELVHTRIRELLESQPAENE